MLKRLVRHRLFQAFLVLVLIIAGLATPIRHEYTQFDASGQACDSVCDFQQTEVDYGVPFIWLKLYDISGTVTIAVNFPGKAVVPIHLMLDLASYIGVILLLAGISKLDDRAMHANLRH